MKNRLHLILLLSVFLLSGCETFQTYYGQTERKISPAKIHYRLDLSFQSLTQLPDGLAQQTELRSLNLSGNPDLDLPKAIDTICTLPKLHILLLNALQLRTLPDGIKKCETLTQLSIGDNPQLNFEQVFEQLTSLKLEFIDLSNNQLTVLPDSLAKLKSLQDLRFSYNHITEQQSYKTLAQLPELFSLWLDNNQLAEIPDEIGLLPKVEYLYLDNNVLTDLPEGISRMPSLRSLWLGHNCFEQIPPILAKTEIYMLFINNNLINNIGPQFKLSSFFLQGIALDNNYLTDMQKEQAAKTFYDTFIYSDSGQQPSQKIRQCNTQGKLN